MIPITEWFLKPNNYCNRRRGSNASGGGDSESSDYLSEDSDFEEYKGWVKYAYVIYKHLKGNFIRIFKCTVLELPVTTTL